jgi:hypothetical protein
MKLSNQQIAARKAWTLANVMASMGSLASMFTPWQTAKFVGAKKAKPAADRRIRIDRPHSPQHVAAVTAMREARRLKRIRRGENLLAEKRRRQNAQWARHESRLGTLSYL